MICIVPHGEGSRVRALSGDKKPWPYANDVFRIAVERDSDGPDGDR